MCMQRKTVIAIIGLLFLAAAFYCGLALLIKELCKHA